MATKKLKVDVDVETSKAKAKLKRELSATESSSPAPSISTATNGAADSVRHLGDAAKETQINMKSAAKAFTGVAVGLAASYAAKNVESPDARAAIEYAGNAVSGASMGAMVAGPIGAAVGGLAGLLKTFFDKEGERKQMSEDFEKAEERYQRTKAVQDRFTDLTDVRKGGGVQKLPELKANLENFKRAADEFLEKYREELAKMNPDKDKLESLKAGLDFSRSWADRYQAQIETLERQPKSDRGGISATDALQRIGGGGSGGRDTAIRLQEDANKILGVIAANTQKGAAWL